MELIMYDTFRDMISEIFNNEDFIEYTFVEGRKYKCVCSPVSNDVSFTEAGLMDTTNFTIDLELATLDRMPKMNDKLVFRDKSYKVAFIQIDSANTTVKLHLIALSKGK